MAEEVTQKEELADNQNLDLDIEQKKAKKKKIIIIISAAFALLVCIAVYFLVIKKTADEDEQMADNTPSAASPSKSASPHQASNSQTVEDVYYDLDNFVINLNSSGGRSRFLKMTITLHIKSDVDVNIISKKIPIIRDNFQFYLRELRPSDLEGSKEMTIVKEELLIRINKILAPIVVQDILFKEILVN
jgi:flagellar basal body-associated protein FliL